MANDVFANGREISCKAGSGKSIAAFPDVCFTPPENPATPPGTPIPYPNTGMASDTTSGSKKVKVSNKEVMLKNKSHFKKSVGDEAGCAAKKGVVTSTNRGKVYFNAWSMDVKVEGKNAVRHLDLTTHNHRSFPGNSPPWAYADSQAGIPIAECEAEVATAETLCEGKETKAEQCEDQSCKNAKKCLLVSYNQGKRKGKTSQVGCCPGEQPHHLVEAHCFYETGKRGSARHRTVKAPPGKRIYKDTDSPCVCALGPRDWGQHGQYHAMQQPLEAAYHEKNGKWTYAEARDVGVQSHKAVNPQCNEECTRAQLDRYHTDRCGIEEDTELRTDPDAGTRSKGELFSDQIAKLQELLSQVTGGTTSSSMV